MAGSASTLHRQRQALKPGKLWSMLTSLASGLHCQPSFWLASVLLFSFLGRLLEWFVSFRGHWQKSLTGVEESLDPGLNQALYRAEPLWDVSFLRSPTSLHSMAPSSGSFCSQILLENLESSGVVFTQAACPDGTGRQYRRLHAEEVIPFISLSFRTSTCAFCVFCSLFPS